MYIWSLPEELAWRDDVLAPREGSGWAFGAGEPVEAGAVSSKKEFATLDGPGREAGRTRGLVRTFLREEREWGFSMTQPAAVAAAAANAGATAFAQTLSTVVVLRFPSFTFLLCRCRPGERLCISDFSASSLFPDTIAHYFPNHF